MGDEGHNSRIVDVPATQADPIQYFVRLCRRGDTTRAERLSILRAQETVLEYQREELDESLKRLHAATVDLEAAERSQGHGML